MSESSDEEGKSMKNADKKEEEEYDAEEEYDDEAEKKADDVNPPSTKRKHVDLESCDQRSRNVIPKSKEIIRQVPTTIFKKDQEMSESSDQEGKTMKNSDIEEEEEKEKDEEKADDVSEEQNPSVVAIDQRQSPEPGARLPLPFPEEKKGHTQSAGKNSDTEEQDKKTDSEEVQEGEIQQEEEDETDTEAAADTEVSDKLVVLSSGEENDDLPSKKQKYASLNKLSHVRSGPDPRHSSRQDKNEADFKKENSL
ncbi:hypothetical protein LOK49_LG15G00857 [Camellia lanceoleosa]|uniref:Uncharacterized protein n=1 Tax=Camellia lanceoleosa TaxID=1840588 RepID=A0ACC0F1C2_9ERIC|nr:hypothetical protein LOK49_LG15G00857 [Camellia lanceoleosa]